MRAAFPKAKERVMARFEWDHGFYAETPIYSHHDRLPHDLAHYAVDAVLRPRYGFWELAARRAPFANLMPSKPWPKDRLAWLATVLRDHRDEMVEAERFPALLSAGGWPSAQQLLKLHWSDWPDNPRPELTRRRYDAMLGWYAQLSDQWRALPLGQTLCLTWPPPA
jgi:hypothetical protein